MASRRTTKKEGLDWIEPDPATRGRRGERGEELTRSHYHHGKESSGQLQRPACRADEGREGGLEKQEERRKKKERREEKVTVEGNRRIITLWRTKE